MWFKNLFIYRLNNWTDNAESLNEKLAKDALAPCGGSDLMTRGWVAPKADGQALVHSCGKHLLISLGLEKRLLPASVIKQFTAARVAEIEEREGYKPGRKQVKEIKEGVTTELIPRAFVIRSRTSAWLDTAGGWLFIDAGSATKAEDLMGQLLKSVAGLSVTPLRTTVSPSTAMTNWLVDGDSPRQFSVDQDCELRGRGEQAATVRYVKHALDSDEIVRHIKGGKVVTRLAMTWADRVSFTLHENLQIKKIAPLDVLKETADNDPDSDAFDTDVALMTGELPKLLDALIQALDGEMVTPDKKVA